jgi:hypothetical protein
VGRANLGYDARRGRGRQLRHEGRGDAAETRHPETDMYREILGDDWEPMGDGIYRFVGKRQTPPPLQWAVRPLAASGDTPGPDEPR